MVDPVFEGLLESRGDDLEFTSLISCDDLLCEHARSHEPLCRYDGLDTTSTTATVSYLMYIGFCAYEISFGPQEFYDILSAFLVRFLSGKWSGFFIHISISIDDSIVLA